MTVIILSEEALERELEKIKTDSTTQFNPEGKKFPTLSITGAAKISVKGSSSGTENYDISPHFKNFSSRGFSSQSYQFASIEEQSEELKADDVNLDRDRSIAGKKTDFVRATGRISGIKFTNFLTESFPKTLPQSQPKIQERQEDNSQDDEEPFWRDVFSLPRSTDLIFSKQVEININELPAWEPQITMDSYRLEEDDDE